MGHGEAFEIPKLRAIASHAVPRILEGTVVPLVLFLVVLELLGVWGALAATLTWTYGAIAVRLVTHRRVPGVLLLGALTATARVTLAILTQSVFMYFLQPTLGTALVGGAFLVSFALRRPLTERLAHDFCPLPETMTSHPRVRQFFMRISLLWAAVFLTNATVTLWLLLNQSVGTFVLAKPFVSFGLTGTGIAVSAWWFHTTMRRHGLLVARLGAAPAVAA
ncbi:MAG TPA: VC0807 family protein [Acidimicrobiia bacterium]|nr:VC0807 family protein [Acidimicrobiia bacterium]